MRRRVGDDDGDREAERDGVSVCVAGGVDDVDGAFVSWRAGQAAGAGVEGHARDCGGERVGERAVAAAREGQGD